MPTLFPNQETLPWKYLSFSFPSLQAACLCAGPQVWLRARCGQGEGLEAELCR